MNRGQSDYRQLYKQQLSNKESLKITALLDSNDDLDNCINKNPTIYEMIKLGTTDKFTKMVNKKAKKFINQMEMQIQGLIYKIFDKQKMSIKYWEQELIQLFNDCNQRTFKGISQWYQKEQYRQDCFEMNSIEQRINEMFRQIEQDNKILFKKLEDMDQEYSYDIKMLEAQRLKMFLNDVWVSNCSTNDSEYHQQIQGYRAKNQNFRIWISWWSNDHNPDRMHTIEFIKTNNICEKMTRLQIDIDDSQSISYEVIQQAIDNFNNIYYIEINDESIKIDYKMHQLLKKLVQRSPLIEFGLNFKQQNSVDVKDTFLLIKEYNQIILKKKKYLQQLWYFSNGVLDIFATNQVEIKNLIIKIQRM